MPTVLLKSNIDKCIRHLRDLQAEAPQMMNEVVWDLTDYAAQLADAEVPVGLPAIGGVGKGTGAGTLKQSLFIQKAPGFGKFGYAAAYAAYVEYGTPAHIIEPGAKGFLAWPIGATQLGKKRGKKGLFSRKAVAIEWVYTRAPVHHPGTQGVFWCRKAKEDAEAKLQEIAAAVFQRYAERLQIGGAKSA